MNPKRIPIKLELGENYKVGWSILNQVECKFIQPTEKGFNFLNIKTHKCILKHHLYHSKINPELFFINPNLKISKCNL